MGIFKYSDILNYCTFISDVQEFKVPDYSSVCSVVNEYINNEYPLISIVKIFCDMHMPFVQNHDFSDIYLYYKNILTLVCKALGRSYNDNMIDIIVMYVFILINQLNDFDEILNQLEVVISTEISVDQDDELWYMKEIERYKVLNIYIDQDANGNIDKIKALLPIVKANKEKYDSITTKIESIK